MTLFFFNLSSRSSLLQPQTIFCCVVSVSVMVFAQLKVSLLINFAYFLAYEFSENGNLSVQMLKQNLCLNIRFSCAATQIFCVYFSTEVSVFGTCKGSGANPC